MSERTISCHLNQQQVQDASPVAGDSPFLSISHPSVGYWDGIDFWEFSLAINVSQLLKTILSCL